MRRALNSEIGSSAIRAALTPDFKNSVLCKRHSPFRALLISVLEPRATLRSALGFINVALSGRGKEKFKYRLQTLTFFNFTFLTLNF